MTVVEEIEESDPTPENGMQGFHQIVVESYEEETPSVQAEETDETEIVEEDEEVTYSQIDQETQGVPELEAPPPPVVSKNTLSAPILSTLRVKEHSQMMVHRKFDFISQLFFLLFIDCQNNRPT